jgi:3-oxoadipate enol-lactonase
LTVDVYLTPSERAFRAELKIFIHKGINTEQGRRSQSTSTGTLQRDLEKTKMPYHEISPTQRINYNIYPPTTTAGNKPWVILINGLADPQTTWADQTPTFTAAGYTVLTYDNRGVGLSWRPSASEAWTAEDMASDLRALVVALQVPKPYHVLGVSMGGMIAQMYGLAAPNEEILSLTPTCTYAAPGPFCGRMFALWGDMARRMSVADAMRDVLLWCFTPEWFADPANRAALEAMETDMAAIDDDMGLAAYLSQLNVITTFDGRPVAGKLADLKHVAVLAGESDHLIPNVLSKELHRLIPGSRWITTRGGHACNWEAPAEFNQTCLQIWSDAEKSPIM